MANSKERETVKEAREHILRLLEKLNGSPPSANSEPKDAEQYHQILSALADSHSVDMVLDAEDRREAGSAAYRYSGDQTGTWAGHWDPMLHGGMIYRDGGPAYGPGDTWTIEQGYAGARRRDDMGRFAAEGQRGGSMRRGTYGGPAYTDGMVARLEDMMETAPAGDRRYFEKVLEHIERQG